MPSVTFTSRNTRNKGLLFNDKEIMTLFLYGIPITNTQGTSLDGSVVDFYIKAAQRELEKFLAIKLVKQVQEENVDYYKNEFYGKGYIRTLYPAKVPIAIKGYLGNQLLITYPVPWLTSNMNNGQQMARNILIVPNSNVADLVLGAVVYGGTVLPYLGLVNSDNIGSYWHISYITGYDPYSIPTELMHIVGKMSAISVLHAIGDIAMGLPAVSSYSVSIDGLSNSVTGTASANTSAYNARINNYTKEINDTLKWLAGSYKGITFTSI